MYGRLTNPRGWPPAGIESAISITRTDSPARQNVLFGAAGRGYADRLGRAPSGGYSTSRSEANWPQSVTRFQQATAHLERSIVGEGCSTGRAGMTVALAHHPARTVAVDSPFPLATIVGHSRRVGCGEPRRSAPGQQRAPCPPRSSGSNKKGGPRQAWKASWLVR